MGHENGVSRLCHICGDHCVLTRIFILLTSMVLVVLSVLHLQAGYILFCLLLYDSISRKDIWLWTLKYDLICIQDVITEYPWSGDVCIASESKHINTLKITKEQQTIHGCIRLYSNHRINWQYVLTLVKRVKRHRKSIFLLNTYHWITLYLRFSLYQFRR